MENGQWNKPPINEPSSTPHRSSGQPLFESEAGFFNTFGGLDKCQLTIHNDGASFKRRLII